MKILMSSERHLAVEGVFVEFDGAPSVFVDSSKCSAEQIHVMKQMVCAQHLEIASDNHLPTPSVPAKEIRKRRPVVSQQSIDLQCANELVHKSGFVFRLVHLKYHATLLVRNYIREMKGLSLSQTSFTFTFDREGVMQGWTRKQNSHARVFVQVAGEKYKISNIVALSLSDS